MPVKFEFFKSPSSSMNNGEKKCHARVIPSGTISTKDLAAEICRATSLTEGDVFHAVMELSYKMGEYLSEGKIVHIDGLGFFQPTLSVPDDCNDKTRAEHVKVKSVSFRPDTELRSRLDTMTTVRSDRKNHSAQRTSDEIDALLIRYLSGHDSITSAQFVKETGLTASTARRKIKQLLFDGKLVNKGTQYSPYYILGEGMTNNK